ncbi:MAG: hypothetical protein HOP15_16845 [Planctomycetes bacterium]|nr:hypothetical protein [Planctomycetota bacterium]
MLSDAAGAFELPAPEGHWALEIDYAGLQRWREESLASGSYRRVILERVRVLVLHVENDEGMPVFDARVLLLDNPYSPPGSARASARSNAVGQAELELQPGGSWFAAVSHVSYRSVVFATPAVQDVAWVERTVTLSKGVRVFGRVTERGSGRAPSGAEVLIDAWSSDATRTISCDAEGRFDTGPVFDADTQLEVTARAPGFGEVRSMVELASDAIENGALELKLALDSTEIRVRGRVVTADGVAPGPVDLFLQPIAECNYLEAIKLTPHAVRWRAQATTDARGAFEVGGLMARQAYQLLVLPREGWHNSLARIPALEPGSVHDLGEIQVAAGGTIFGFARHPDGAPVPHLLLTGIAAIHVTLSQSKDPAFFPAYEAARLDSYTNQEGRFELDLLPDGATYDLYWGEGKTDPKRHVGQFTLRGGETIGPVEIVVPSLDAQDEVSVKGIVTDPSGMPIEWVLVEVWSGPETDIVGEGYRVGQLTDASGAFDLRGLSSFDEYRVTATDLRGRFEKETTTVARPREGDALSLVLLPSPTSPLVLEGIVSDPDGRPVSGIDLTLQLSPLLARCNCLAWNEKSNESGGFSFGFVEDGVHQIAVVDRLGRYRPTIVTARPGTYLSIRVE